MIKKIILIFVTIILLVADICIKSNYNFDSTKIVVRNNITFEQLIDSYINEMFEELKDGNFEYVYNKIQTNNFSNIDEFSKYITEMILVKDSMISVEEIKQIENAKYSIKIKVDSPLFTSKEKLQIEAYKKKYLNLVIQFNDMFNYKILEFKKV